MSFKKIIPEVREALEAIDIVGLNGINKEFFSLCKSGSHTCLIAPETTDKSDALISYVFHKVNQETEGSPRALIICSNIDRAEALSQRMQRAGRKLDVTIDLAHDKGNILQQRNDIFDGTEIIVGTPKRIHELYLQNGINLNLLELFIVEDLEIVLQRYQMEIKRLTESMDKVQFLFTANSPSQRIDPFLESLERPIRILEEE